MKLNDYQEQAARTIVTHDGVTDPLVIPLLGLVGEAGELLSEYKRKLRDRDAHELFVDVIREESETSFGIPPTSPLSSGSDLRTSRRRTLTSCGTATSQRRGRTHSLMNGFLPRNGFLVPSKYAFTRRSSESVRVFACLKRTRPQIGDELTDNAYTDDGYRFHDIFHFSYATHLGWSPVTRKFLRRKRASNGDLDEIEDGGRAWVFEEAISALVFQHARRMRYFEGVRRVDGRLLKEIKSLTSGIEVRIRSKLAWEEAILGGYDIWRKVRDHRGGWVSCDLIHKKMTFRPCTPEDLANFARRTDELEFAETGDIQPIASHVV